MPSIFNNPGALAFVDLLTSAKEDGSEPFTLCVLIYANLELYSQRIAIGNSSSSVPNDGNRSALNGRSELTADSIETEPPSDHVISDDVGGDFIASYGPKAPNFQVNPAMMPKTSAIAIAAPSDVNRGPIRLASATTQSLSHPADSFMPKQRPKPSVKTTQANKPNLLDSPPFPNSGVDLEDDDLDFAEAMKGWPESNGAIGDNDLPAENNEESLTGFQPAAGVVADGTGKCVVDTAITSEQVSDTDPEGSAPLDGPCTETSDPARTNPDRHMYSGYDLSNASKLYCKLSPSKPHPEPDWRRAYAALWNNEFVLARDFGNGRHDQEDVGAFVSVRKAMAKGLKPLSSYASTILRTTEDDLKEESKVRREGAATLRAAARHVRQGSREYTDFLRIIDAGLC
ncbi:hypothetical protein HWV62_43497 [Athelia sp. TMB]|nr:hypothetical protein HWV62_43497 [Athelia sp. TMB]